MDFVVLSAQILPHHARASHHPWVDELLDELLEELFEMVLFAMLEPLDELVPVELPLNAASCNVRY